MYIIPTSNNKTILFEESEANGFGHTLENKIPSIFLLPLPLGNIATYQYPLLGKVNELSKNVSWKGIGV